MAFLLLAWVLVLASPSWSATYYIDITAGADTNNGTAKATPWKHIPGMPTCTNTCASTTPTAGDTFILKGGETWGTANFPVKWIWSGSSGNVITIGVDATWYTGGAWARPVWDGEDTATSDTIVATTAYAFWHCDFGATTCQYITLSNFELTRFRWSGAPSAGFCAQVNAWGTTNVIIDQFYIHDWTHGAATGDCHVVSGQSGVDAATTLQNSVVDGSRDVSGTVGSGLMQYVLTTTNNYFTNISGMALPAGGPGLVSGNTFAACTHSFVVGDHNNWVESLGVPAAAANFNTVIKNNFYGGASDNGCEAMLVGNPYEQLYIFNNVIWDLSSNAPALGQNIGAGTANARAYIYNNTIVAPTGQSCMRTGSGTMVLIEYKNNHCITSGTDPGTFTATTVNTATNLTQSLATVNSEGYTNAQTYKYSPTDAGDSTVGTGTDLTASCSGPLADLCSDTTYGVTRTASNTVTVTRTSNPRPNGSAWDIGAYQYRAPNGSIRGSKGLGLY